MGMAVPDLRAFADAVNNLIADENRAQGGSR